MTTVTAQTVFKDVKVLASEKAQKAVQMISEAAKDGKFFTVGFTKKDGSQRVMNARMGVTKHLKGGKKTLTDNYICVYDVKTEGYRSINPETVYMVNGQQI